jgi:hypothetical protein
MAKLIVHIKLESKKEPERTLNSVNVKGTLESIICSAVQSRFPEYDVELGSLEADWPDSEKNFPKIDSSDY